MSEPDHSREFPSLPTPLYPSEDDVEQNPVQPALDTLFSEFARRHRSLSPSTQSSPRSVRGHVRQVQLPTKKPPTIDLRVLEYASGYDSHLMCPICHIPFVDPVVLDCDHTFCASCYNEYRNEVLSSEPSRCPSCRALVLSSPRKASRLIYNMCNDIKVRCPNQDCTVFVARGYIEQHAARDCPEQKLVCPDTQCEKQTRRKNYVPGQCVHATHAECDCGAVIELGGGEWLRHKDEDCPNTRVECKKCGERISSRDIISNNSHVCPSGTGEQRCPGAEFGCTDEVLPEDIENHIPTCTFARLAPHLKSQSRLLRTMQDQLATSKLRNENLETELDRMNNLITSQIQPRLDNLTLASRASDLHPDTHLNDQDNDIEEIPRDNIPSAAAVHHRDLLLSAHIRDLTPSPDTDTDIFTHNSHANPHLNVFHHNQTQTHHMHMNNHLLSLHESLRHTVSTLESEIHTLHHSLAELDARTSMQLMNETLRIREDLAYTNAAVVSHRSQVQWLLNRERVGREQAILRERGRVGGQGTGGGGGQGRQSQNGESMERQWSNVVSPGGSTTQQQQQGQGPVQAETFPFPSPSVGPGAGMTRTVSGGGSISGRSSASTSPMFTGINMVGASAGSTRRPSARGGSQERVKL